MKKVLLITLVTMTLFSVSAIANGLKSGNYTCRNANTRTTNEDYLVIENESGIMNIEMSAVDLQISKENCKILDFQNMNVKCGTSKFQVTIVDNGEQDTILTNLSWEQIGDDIVSAQRETYQGGSNRTILICTPDAKIKNLKH